MMVSITTWQRVKLSQVIGEQGGLVEAIATYMPIFLKLRLTDDEKKVVGWHVNPEGNAAWNPENSNTRWELEFTKEEMQLIKQAVRGHRGWVTGNSEQIVDLFESLSIEFPEG